MTITVQQAFGVHPHAISPAYPKRSFVIGSEYEIESIKDDNIADDLGLMSEMDHSLRNNGKEYKTKPQNKAETLKQFAEFHKGLKVGKDPFSERTSIHVHMNVQDLTVQEARQLVLVYALFEPLFFDFVGEKRKNSIFCVPLNYTALPNSYKLELAKLRDKWSKYTAFNLLPIGGNQGKDGVKNLGTVEFRHLYGTGNVTVFSTWLNALEELYTFIEQGGDAFNITAVLQSGADVAGLAQKVVPTLAQKHTASAIRSLCADTLLDVKLSAGGLNSK